MSGFGSRKKKEVAMEMLVGRGEGVGQGRLFLKKKMQLQMLFYKRNECKDNLTFWIGFERVV